jgi:putative copper resistance protein D
MSEAVTPWLHILAVAVWVGPQFFLFIAALPAIRTIEDRQTRARVMRIIVTRFGWLTWAAMLVIVLSGISNLFQVGADTPLSSATANDFRYGRIFAEKMVFVGIAVALTAVHTFVVGPRQLALAEQMDADPAETARLRRISIVISSVALLASVLAIFMGALLADHDYSFEPD